MYLNIVVNLPAVTVETGVVIAFEVTRFVICDIVVVNFLVVTVGIGVLVAVEVTREVVGVYDTVVVPTAG